MEPFWAYEVFLNRTFHTFFESRTVQSPDLLNTIQDFAQTIPPQGQLHQREHILDRIRTYQKQLDAGPLPVEAILIDALCYEEELGVQAALTLMLKAAQSPQDISAIAWYVAYKSSFLGPQKLKEALDKTLPQLKQRSFSCLEALCRRFFLASEHETMQVPKAPELKSQLLKQLIRKADARNPTQVKAAVAVLKGALESPSLHRKLMEQRRRVHATELRLRELEQEQAWIQRSYEALTSNSSRTFGPFAAFITSAASLAGPIAKAGAAVISGASAIADTAVDVIRDVRASGLESKAQEVERNLALSQRNFQDGQDQLQELERAQQQVVLKAAAKGDYPSALLRLGYPLEVLLEILPQNLDLDSEKQVELNKLIVERTRAENDPGFAKSFAAYFDRVLQSSRSPKHAIELINTLAMAGGSDVKVVHHCVDACIEHTQSLDPSLLKRTLETLRSSNFKMLHNPALNSADASLLVDLLLCKLIQKPSVEQLHQLVRLARARGLNDGELARLAAQEQVPRPLRARLHSLLGIADSTAGTLLDAVKRGRRDIAQSKPPPSGVKGAP